MSDPNHTKPGPRPGGGGPDKPESSPSGTAPSDKTSGSSSGGRIVHDSRGNAVWQWVKDTGRHAIESTSALLKKLEAPELKLEEDEKVDDGGLQLEQPVDPGGGYDPYGAGAGSKKPPPPKLKKR